MRKFLKIVCYLLFGCVTAVLITAVPTSEVMAESPEDLLIIGNNSITASDISHEEVRAIFLKKKGTLKGRKVVVINARDGSTLRAIFQSRVLRMTNEEEAAYWEELKVKKGLLKPTEISKTLKAVFSVKGSIGYCRRSQFKEGAAKILAVL
jgi:ABC-type phosphate transport system substrate-binding protein